MTDIFDEIAEPLPHEKQSFSEAVQGGKKIMTSGVMDLMNGDMISYFEFIFKHANGTHGEICEEDQKANEEAKKTGARVMSVYKYKDQDVWVITDSGWNLKDRGPKNFDVPAGEAWPVITTALLLSEY